MHVLRSASESSSLLRLLAHPVLRLDDRLRRRNGVYEYSNDLKCMFRMQLDVAWQNVTFSDGSVIRKGDKVVNIHLWNEHVPEIPPEGPTFAWARRLGSSFEFSLRQLAAFIARHPELADVAAIRAYAAVATSKREVQLLRLMGHFGFETVAGNRQLSWAGRLREYGENLLGLMLVLAVNPVVARVSILWRVRSQVLLPRKTFDQRYGVSSHGAATSIRRQRGEPAGASAKSRRSQPAAMPAAS